jgi:hypothetical protein
MMNSYERDISIMPFLKGELQKLSILLLIVRIRKASLRTCPKEYWKASQRRQIRCLTKSY